MIHWYSIVVQTPAHSPLAGLLTYQSEQLLDVGSFVRVPLGSRELLGVVWRKLDLPPEPMLSKHGKEIEVKAITAGLGIQAVSPAWLKLVAFTATYYQRSLGEVALAALPPQLRTLDALQVERRLKRTKTTQIPAEAVVQISVSNENAINNIALQAEQTLATAKISTESGPFLLFGATGSGKTEVYLRAALEALQRDPAEQVLMMVPEINLTPQLEDRVRARICPLYGDAAVVSLHSGMTNPQRLKSWLSAHMGTARVVLGTRMAIFASMPHLKLIVVDEEHDPSYKSQEGARYSARDLAVFRGKLEHAKVILGSATPSFESWHHSSATSDGGAGRYLRLTMAERIGGGVLPKVITVNMEHQPKKTVISPPLLNAIAERIARGEQAMLFLNRRGLAPVLPCGDCGWKSYCPHCSAYRVFHKIDRTLRCHHCGFTQRVPRACPACGNLDITTIGRGTEQLEEQLAELLAHVTRPDGSPVRISRIDADTTKLKGALQQQLAQVHAGEVDVLVGTQMIAKGHDFHSVTLVGVISVDTGLGLPDFRSAERTFQLITQVAGRAGRGNLQGRVLIQTYYPEHYALRHAVKQDFEGFFAEEIRYRERLSYPPFVALASILIKHSDLGTASKNAQIFKECLDDSNKDRSCRILGVAPASLSRLKGEHRLQILVKSANRRKLRAVLDTAMDEAERRGGDLRIIQVEIDPVNLM